MSTSIQTTVTYSTVAPITLTSTDLVLITLSALHPRTNVARHNLFTDEHVVEITLWIDAAGPGEIEDIQQRLRDLPGVPAHDVRTRPLLRNR